MSASMYLLTFTVAAAFSASVSLSVAPPSAPTCTTSTRTATFDNLPTGTMSSTANHNGLHYSGWEVIAARDTVFRAHSGHKILRMISNAATISSADKGQYYNDRGDSASPSFYFGCQNDTVAEACGFDKQYDVPGQTTYGGYFNSTNYPHVLEPAGGIESIATTMITWTLYTGTRSTAPRNLHLYIDSYRYMVTNCKT